MATLTVDGKQVSVDDSFLDLSPAEQNSTVAEIASSIRRTPLEGFDQNRNGGVASQTGRPATTPPGSAVAAASGAPMPMPGPPAALGMAAENRPSFFRTLVPRNYAPLSLAGPAAQGSSPLQLARAALATGLAAGMNGSDETDSARAWTRPSEADQAQQARDAAAARLGGGGRRTPGFAAPDATAPAIAMAMGQMPADDGTYGARNFAPLSLAGPIPQAQTPEQFARQQLALGLAAHIDNGDEGRRAEAFRENGGWKPATARDIESSVGTYGLTDMPWLAWQTAKDVALRGENPVESYRSHRAAIDDWLAHYGKPPIAAGSIEDARAQLGKELTARKYLDDEDGAYRGGAFRLGFSPVGWKTALLEGLSLHTRDEGLAAAHALLDKEAYGQSFSEAYPHYLAAERDRLDKYRVEHPTAAWLAETGGSFLTGALAAAVGGPGVAILSGGLDGAASRDGAARDRMDGATEGARNKALIAVAKEIAKLSIRGLLSH
jgi:hypothetical protein